MIKKLLLFLYLILIVSLCMAENLKSFTLNTGWTFKSSEGTNWKPAVVPGTVQSDLLRNGEIPEPYYRLNEHYIQWVDKQDWIYKTEFNFDEKLDDYDKIYLNFSGLDTYADVYLNNKKILSADNMFRTWEVSVKNLIQCGKNELLIYFHSPIKRGLKLLNDYGYTLPAINDQAMNGGLKQEELVSPFIRKAPYHFGWDWGPRIVTSGVFRPIRLLLQKGNVIKDVYYRQDKVTSDKAIITACITIDGVVDDRTEVRIKNEETGEVYASQVVNCRAGVHEFELSMKINKPRLWWCNGLGKQELYKLSAEIVKDDIVVASHKETIGLRSLQFIEKKDKYGLSCYFELNGVPVFMKGANHIPNDLFVDRMTHEVYDLEIEGAAQANMNMLRVWGGGIYEDDYFYRKCDEQGILVWQDFMFACSMYPESKEFYESVYREAIDNVKRLRNHPCIALWCGNNEIDVAWSEYQENVGWGWKEKMNKVQREQCWRAYTKLFKEILPNVVSQYDNRAYRHSSPMTSNPYISASYNTLDDGDIHYWGVWHGKEPFENYHNVLGRFMSEYGFQSFPEMKSIVQYALPDDYNIESDVMKSHQRSPIGNKTITEYMSKYYNVPSNFEDYIYLQQVLQAEGISTAINAHRQNMPHTMGSLYWQINDCWPVASWSSMDYYRRWKALHYFVRKAFEPFLLTSRVEEGKIILSAVNDRLSTLKNVEYVCDVVDLNGRKIKNLRLIKDTKANAVTKVFELELNKLNISNNQFVIFRAYNGNLEIGSHIYYPYKIKDMELPIAEPKIQLKQEGDGTIKLVIESPKLIKNLWLDFEGKEGFFSDNYFDVLPGNSIEIEFKTRSNYSLEDLKKCLKYKSISCLNK